MTSAYHADAPHEAAVSFTSLRTLLGERLAAGPNLAHNASDRTTGVTLPHSTLMNAKRLSGTLYLLSFTSLLILEKTRVRTKVGIHSSRITTCLIIQTPVRLWVRLLFLIFCHYSISSYLSLAQRTHFLQVLPITTRLVH
jgi:hypothetical protein